MPKSVETLTAEMDDLVPIGPYQNAESVENAVFEAMFDMNSGEAIIVSKEGNGEWYIYIRQ